MLIIAHRGARREAPENTLRAFERAIERGADGIEFDVLLTKDQVPVVTHNNDLSILTEHKGFVDKTPYSAIKTINFNKNGDFVPCPTLSEALETIKPHNILTIVEIKAQKGLTKMSALIAGRIIVQTKMTGTVIVSSMSHRIISNLKKFYPELSRAFILKTPIFSFLHTDIFGRFEGIEAVHSSRGALSKRLVDRMHSRGKQIFAWTVNDKKAFDRCRNLQVDGVITDDIRSLYGK